LFRFNRFNNNNKKESFILKINTLNNNGSSENVESSTAASSSITVNGKTTNINVSKKEDILTINIPDEAFNQLLENSIKFA
jgi:hypothetical protein